MADDHQQDVLRLAEQMRPASILVLGGECGLFNEYLHAHPAARLVCVSHGDWLASVDALGRLDLAYVSGVLERVDKHTGEMLLARLRDLHAQRVVVALRVEPGDDPATWHEADLLALGLIRIGRYPRGEAEVRVYTFDLHDYRITPDWLNSRDWAHPELFDKYWW